MLLFVCLQHYRPFFNKILPRIFFFIALCCIATEALHGVYYNIKIIRSHRDLGIIKDADKGYKNFSSVIAEIKQKYPGREILISSPDQYYLHGASQMGYKAIFDYKNLSQVDLKLSTKSILVMPVHQQEAIIVNDYIEKKKTAFVFGNFRHLFLYRRIQSLMRGIKKIMESRVAGIFCVVFAIANRIIFTSLYSLIGVDSKLQLVYAENLLAGRGMGVTKYFTADLNASVFDTQQVFPPGFTFAIIPFLKLFGGDEYKAVLAYDIVVAVLFIVAVRLLGKKAGLSPELNNIITLVAGCSQYFFFMSWSSTDAIGVCLLLFSMVAVIDIINKKEYLGLARAIGIGILFCLPFLFRFMYLPVAILMPLYILVSGIVLKNSELKSDGVRILIVCASFLILYFGISSFTSRNALYITDVGRGFFIDQFTAWYPFLPASFINIDFGAQLVQSVFRLDYSDTIFILKIMNALIFVLLIFLLWRYINRQKRAMQIYSHHNFIILGSLLSLLIVLLLSWPHRSKIINSRPG